MKRLSLYTALLLTASRVWALSPMYGAHDLVAGEGTAGFKDGPFYSALFNGPRGLALDADKGLLYVADSGNHAIRVIDLAHRNRVWTLAGGGKPGFADGPVSQAAFDRPTCLALLPHHRLAVADNGNARIRLLDLEKEVVSTLVGTGKSGVKDGKALQAQVGSIWNMAYVAGEDCLYFTEPDSGTLRRLDLGSGRVLTLFANDRQSPHPAALCTDSKRIYLADRDNGSAFKTEEKTNDKKGVYRNLVRVAIGSKILALEWSGDSMLAIQADGNTPVAQLLPGYKPIHSLTAWGGSISNPAGFYSWRDQPSGPFSLVSDPSSPGKFYVANPADQVITSFRDLSYEALGAAESKNSSGLLDFEYPASKPAGTFRILLVGDSHLYHDDFQGGKEIQNRMELTAKRLELELNTLSTLEDGPFHFEVLTQAQNAWFHLNTWPYYEVPDKVKRYDADLVLLVLTPDPDLANYFDRPLTAEGIPAERVDPEYLLKPVEERVPAGLPSKFFQLCLSHKWVDTSNGKQARFDWGSIVGDPEAESDAVSMYSLPLKLLGRKFASMRTKEGAPVRMEIVLLPSGRFEGASVYTGFWKDVLEGTGVPSMDFTPLMTVLRLTYYPFSEVNGNDHFDSNGHLLISSLLMHELVRRGVIPLGEGLKSGSPSPKSPAL